MPIAKPTLTTPPAAPDKNGSDAATFDAAMQAFLDWMETFGVEAQDAVDYFEQEADAAQVAAAAASADAGQVAADKATVAADKATADAASAAAQGHAATAATHKDTATAQANAAAASAASAASVLAQDLSAATAASLHRSPNAITGIVVYDTATDADGGAWVAAASLRSSLALEALNGVWRGACASEAACRAISGAATGDYFQLTTDGKFYKLNAGTGVAEVQTGNSTAIPRMMGLVLEASALTIYDLLAVGRPMWRRFPVGGTGLTSSNAVGNSTSTLGTAGYTCQLDARGGVIAITDTSTTGVGTMLIDLVADEVRAHKRVSGTAWGTYRYNGTLADRSAGKGWSQIATWTGVSTDTHYSVALGNVPGAPARAGSTLPIVTVAIGTAIALIVQKPDGTFVTPSLSTTVFDMAFDPRGGVVFNVGRGGSLYRVCAAPAYTSVTSYTGAPTISADAPWSSLSSGYAGRLALVQAAAASTAAHGGSGAAQAGIVLNNDSAAAAAGLGAVITNTHTSGVMFGTPSGAWLGCASVAGAVSAADLVTGDSATFTGGVGAWATSSAYASTASAVSGELQVTATVAYGRQVLPVSGLVVGRAYLVEVDCRRVSGSGGATVEWTTSTGATVATALPTASVTSGTASTLRSQFVATATTGYIAVGEQGNTSGSVHAFDNVKVREVALDLSRRRRGLKANGATLTLSPVATGAQLLAASGFSASAYFSAVYDAAADAYGTGAFTASVWASIPATVSADSVIMERTGASGSRLTLGVNASGQPYVTVSDGTTTRTATGPFALGNVGKFEKLRLSYDGAGTVALWLGAKIIASATGAALLTTDNSGAEWRVGNSYDGTKPWPGSIVLAKASAGVPTAEQAAWMYEQEAALFAPGAQCTLPVASAPLPGGADQSEDAWYAVQTTMTSKFRGLTRVATYAPSTGSMSRVAAQSGVMLAARTAPSPGVDAYIPAQALRSELYRLRGAARGERRVFDYDAVTSQTDFALPAGWRVVEVISAGAAKREGSTKDWTRLWDGFIETARFAVAPGNAVWVQIVAERI